MRKYIDVDKLIAEIERWRDKEKKTYNESTYSMGRCDALAEFRNHIVSLQQDQPEVDLDALVNEAFDKYSSVDGYGQLSASFNRAELYSFIKKIARKEE